MTTRKPLEEGSALGVEPTLALDTRAVGDLIGMPFNGDLVDMAVVETPPVAAPTRQYLDFDLMLQLPDAGDECVLSRDGGDAGLPEAVVVFAIVQHPDTLAVLDGTSPGEGNALGVAGAPIHD